MILSLLLAAAQPQPQQAADADSAAVLATIDKMFAALTAKDPAGIEAVTLPEGNATGATVAADGTPSVRTSKWSDFSKRIAGIPGTPVERNIGPHVHVDGDIAMVWTPFVFTLDGKLSHCGINHFDLVRKGGEWKILNVTWTQRKTGCPAE